MLYFSSIESVASYIVLDAARVGERMDAIRKLSPEAISLYKGTAGEELDAVAPFLLRCAPGSKINQLLFAEGWGKSWGILLAAGATLAAVEHHLRHFLVVEDATRRKLYFRYYDPRVLRVFLPTCSAAQLKQLFGPVRRFIVEDEDPTKALMYRLDGTDLKKEIIDLTRQPAEAPAAPVSVNPPVRGEETTIV